MQMDGLESCKQSKQTSIMPLKLSAPVQQIVNNPIVYSERDGLVLKSERENGYDLESGIKVTEPEPLSSIELIKKSFRKIGNWFRLTLILKESEDDPAGKNVIQCGAVQEKNAKMIFPSHHNTVKESTVTAVANQSQDMGLAKGMGTLSGCSEKAKEGNGNCDLKPSWKRPPRPPRPPRRARDASRERYMKGISDTSVRRKARLEEKLKSARSHKFAKPSSQKTTFWALFVTLSFGVIMITRGIFSQGNGSLQDLSPSPSSGQESPLSIDNFKSPASNDESMEHSSIGQTASGFSLLTSRKMQIKGYPVR